MANSDNERWYVSLPLPRSVSGQDLHFFIIIKNLRTLHAHFLVTSQNFFSLF